MLAKIFCVITYVYVVLCASVKDYKGEESSSPFYELPCSAYGGICLQKNECPEGNEALVKGLCPLQQSQGVECCHSVSKSANTCRSRGGECVDSSFQCPNSLTFSKATDCATGETCCIFIK